MASTSEIRIQAPQLGAFAAPDRILVATDLIDGKYLIPYVVAQAKASRATVTLLHAIPPVNPISIEGGVAYIDQDAIDRDVSSALLDLAGQIARHGVSCEVSVQHGSAADAVREALHDTGATRVIMGTHGRGKLGQLALGSVAHELLRTADVPIFAIGPGAIGPGAAAVEGHATPRKILHPVSLAGDFQKSIDFAVDVAKSYGAELTLLHVVPPDVGRAHDSERNLNWTRNALVSVIPREADFARVHAMAACGKVVEEILKAASEIGADWIVLGVEADSSLWSFKDSTAYRVLAAANCPVMTIRHDPRVTEKQKSMVEHNKKSREEPIFSGKAIVI